MSTDLVPNLYRFGKIADEPIDQYHASDCLSKSKLDVFRQSPLLFWKKFVVKTIPKDEPTDALIVGQGVDTLAIEGPEAFAARFSVVPNDAPRKPTAAQRLVAAGGEVDAKGRPKKPSQAALLSIAFWDEYNAANRGKWPLTSDQEALVKRCADALNSDEYFTKLREGGKPQLTFRIQGEHISVQCRPDIYVEGNELSRGLPRILDVKTIAALEADQQPDYSAMEPEEQHVEDLIPQHVANWGYHRGAWFYPEVVANVEQFANGFRPDFVLCFVEKAEPHAVTCRPVSAEAVAVGGREVRDAVKKLTWCIQHNTWPAYWNKPLAAVGLPPYYVRQSLNRYDASI